MQKLQMERIAYWEEIYGKYLSSGMTKVGFCQERQIKLGTFYYWAKKFRQESAGGGFVRVDCRQREPIVGAEQVVVEYPNGVRIKVGVDMGLIQKLIQLL